jgi:hypothetical protein
MPIPPRRLACPSSLITIIAIGSACAPTPPQTIHVIAHDYAFSTPEAAHAGPVTFTLENRGTKQHELFIGLLRPRTTSAQITEAHQKGITFRQLPDVYLDGEPSVALFAWPGKTSPARVTLDLVRGRSYILFCQLRDSIGLPQHAALGMFRLLQVE